MVRDGSGAGEWKKLYQVSLRLEKIESRRRLLEERLKELGLQVENGNCGPRRKKNTLLERNGEKPEHSIFRK